MSLILEALKKSEQQRRLGEAPTLASPVVATRRRRSVLPILAILIVIAAGAAWWLMRSPPQPAATAPTSAGTATPSTTPAGAARTATPPAANAKGARTAPLADIEAKRRAERTAQMESDKHGAPATTAAATKPVAKSSVPGTAPVAAPGVRKLGDPSPPGVAATAQKPTDKPSDAITPMTAKPGDSIATKPAPPATTPAATAPARTTPAEPALPTIWDLPYATRKDIPAIDLTMHVYSADPAQRFVVIKGTRHVEGDEIDKDLTLREIRQDGLVLEFKGQRFVFPRSGR